MGNVTYPAGKILKDCFLTNQIRLKKESGSFLRDVLKDTNAPAVARRKGGNSRNSDQQEIYHNGNKGMLS